MKNYFLAAGLLALVLTGCPHHDSNPPEYTFVNCSHSASDSSIYLDGTIANLIFSANSGSPVYYEFNGARKSANSNNAVTLDYMVHESVGPVKALLVLIAGGQLNASLVGTSGDGSLIAPYGTGINFLVRSAHFFAQSGYKVLTIDQPSDAAYYINGLTNGWALDNYRISLAHLVDLSETINRANTTNLPVIVAGTSRGAISAVRHSEIFSALALSSPATGGNNGYPVIASDAILVTNPTLVLWHANDTCSSTPVGGSVNLLNVIDSSEGSQISGGYNPVGMDACSALGYHGFYGIESCTVQQHVDWFDLSTPTLPASIATTSLNTSTTSGIPIQINLSTLITSGPGSGLTYSLPFTSTQLGGQLSIVGNTVSYNNTSGNFGFNDTFVFVVKGADGSIGHNVINVSVTP